MTDSLHENNPDKEFDELHFAVDDDGTNILIIINKGEITGAVDIDNIFGGYTPQAPVESITPVLDIKIPHRRY